MVTRQRSCMTTRNDGLPVINRKKVRRVGSRSTTKTANSVSFSTSSTIVLGILLVVTFSSKLMSSSDNASPGVTEKSSTVSVTNTEVIAQVKADPVPTASSETKNRFPNVCSDEQKALVKKQLPYTNGCDRFWLSCSTTIATVDSGYAHNPVLMREFYASDEFKLDETKHSFFSVLMQWQNNDVPMDTFRIGSRENKCGVDDAMLAKLGLDQKQSRPPITISPDASKRPASVLVLDWTDIDRAKPKTPLETIKSECGFSDNELRIEKVKRSGYMDTPQKNGLTKFIESKLPETSTVKENHPIHYLELEMNGGFEPLFLNTLMSGLLKNVRYLHFHTNKEGYWRGGHTANKFELMQPMLKAAGLVCYWAGKKESDYSLWRITDCWLDHYHIDHWAGVSCVNVNHDDVKVLADRMEQKFLDTIRKTQVYEGASFSF